MPTCNDNNNTKICLRFFHGEAMAQWYNRALIDPRVAGSNPAGQLLICFHNVFPVLTKTMSAFKSSPQIPHQSFRAQTALLPTSAFGSLAESSVGKLKIGGFFDLIGWK